MTPIAITAADLTQARQLAGLHQDQLAALLGTSERTMARWSTAGVPATAHRLAQARRFLDQWTSPNSEAADEPEPDGPDPATIPHAALMAEVVRRLAEAEAILAHSRITTGAAPDDLATRPGVRHAPPYRDENSSPGR